MLLRNPLSRLLLTCCCWTLLSVLAGCSPPGAPVAPSQGADTFAPIVQRLEEVARARSGKQVQVTVTDVTARLPADARRDQRLLEIRKSQASATEHPARQIIYTLHFVREKDHWFCRLARAEETQGTARSEHSVTNVHSVEQLLLWLGL